MENRLVNNKQRKKQNIRLVCAVYEKVIFTISIKIPIKKCL